MHAHRFGRIGVATVAALANVLPTTGYALWAMIGTAVAFDFELDGRGVVLVQLTLGLSFLVIGALAAFARRPLQPLWRSLATHAPLPPTRERLLAAAALLPMLGVAGLARGDNAFWATRLFGAILALACLATLATRISRSTRKPPSAVGSNAESLMTSLFGGGLWFWTCLALQSPAQTEPWMDVLRLVLLVIGLAAALSQHLPSKRHGLALLLAFVVPCLALVIASTHHLMLAMAIVAALSATVGLCLDAAFAHMACAGGARSIDSPRPSG
jgi:hypothetical protein